MFLNLLSFLELISNIFVYDKLITHQMVEFMRAHIIGMMESDRCQGNVAEAADIDQSTVSRL